MVAPWNDIKLEPQGRGGQVDALKSYSLQGYHHIKNRRSKSLDTCKKNPLANGGFPSDQ